MIQWVTEEGDGTLGAYGQRQQQYKLNPPILENPGMKLGPGPTRHWKITIYTPAVYPEVKDVYMNQLQVQQHLRNLWKVNAGYESTSKIMATPAPGTPIPTGGAYGFETTDGQHIVVLQGPLHASPASPAYAVHGIPEGTGSVEWVAGGMLGFTQAELDAMPSYQACIGAQISSCNAAFPNWTDADQKTALDACIKTAQGTCKLQVELAATQTLSPSAITALQNQINAELKKYQYCPIGVDGKLGGETCGAAIWAAGVGAALIVPSQCNSIKNTFQLKDCPAGGGGGGGGCNVGSDCAPNQICINGKCEDCPPGSTRDASGACALVPAAPAKSNWGLALLAGGAAVAAFFGLRAAGVGGDVPRSPAQRQMRENPRRRRRA
jgi:hypothetical protein